MASYNYFLYKLIYLVYSQQEQLQLQQQLIDLNVALREDKKKNDTRQRKCVSLLR